MLAVRPKRILIVDDSAVMRSLLRSVVSGDSSLEVAGTAADGESALRSMDVLHPDLILLDVEMPVMDGLVTLREMRSRGHRMPVVMCSSLTQRGARVTIEALACGASDYVTKPSGQASRESATKALAQELIPKIHALTVSVRTGAQSLQLPPGRARPGLFSMPARRSTSAIARPAVVAIGVSTGGPAALDVLLPALPGNFPIPILIVQHMPELFTSLLAERLNGRCSLRVREAAEGDSALPGTVSIARGNWHLEVLAPPKPGQFATMHLNQGRLENHCRPAVDALFRSVASVYGSSVLAVVLTGMGSDGLAGCRAIRDHGGSVLVQDENSSTIWGMPGAVAQAGLAHDVLPLSSIACEIVRLTTRAQIQSNELARSVV
jgi:two-component system, chemotaxis family, protein-glutamate methylesterase/glutaminase